MEKKTLEELKASIEQQFNATAATNKELNQQINNNTETMLKLSGKFELVNELLANFKEEQAKKEKKDGR